MKKLVLLFSLFLAFNTNAQDNIPNIDLKTLDGKTLNIQEVTNKDNVVFLSCSTDLVEQLWKSSNLQELSSYIVSFDYLIKRDVFLRRDTEIEVDNGLDFLTLIDKKRNRENTDIYVYEVKNYIEVGEMVYQPHHYHNEDGGGKILS